MYSCQGPIQIFFQGGGTKNLFFRLRYEIKISHNVKYCLSNILAGLLEFNVLAQFGNISFGTGCSNPFSTFPHDTSKLADLFSTLSIYCWSSSTEAVIDNLYKSL